MGPHNSLVLAGGTTLECNEQNYTKCNVEGTSEGDVMNNAERAYPGSEAKPTIAVSKHQESCEENYES